MPPMGNQQRITMNTFGQPNAALQNDYQGNSTVTYQVTTTTTGGGPAVRKSLQIPASPNNRTTIWHQHYSAEYNIANNPGYGTNNNDPAAG